MVRICHSSYVTREQACPSVALILYLLVLKANSDQIYLDICSRAKHEGCVATRLEVDWPLHRSLRNMPVSVADMYARRVD
jgi:hypothetical protein